MRRSRQDDLRKGWIPKSRLQCYVSKHLGKRTTDRFWNWATEEGRDRLHIRRDGARIYIHERSLRRYLGIEENPHGQHE